MRNITNKELHDFTNVRMITNKELHLQIKTWISSTKMQPPMGILVPDMLTDIT